MKKILRNTLIAAFCGAGLLAVSTDANAQRGEKTLGIAGGFATYNDGGFMDIYFQYSFANHVRIAPEIGYVFRNDGA